MVGYRYLGSSAIVYLQCRVASESTYRCAPPQAAVYGRAFVAADAFPKDGIISIARKLRILNALREPEVSVPMPTRGYDSSAQLACRMSKKLSLSRAADYACPSDVEGLPIAAIKCAL